MDRTVEFLIVSRLEDNEYSKISTFPSWSYSAQGILNKHD